MAEKQGPAGLARKRKLAETYFAQCDAEERTVTIGGFCRALEITLETLREWSDARWKDGKTAKQLVFLDRFWTRYFAAAEADLDGKDTQTAAKFKLERLMPLFVGSAPDTGENAISVRFDERIEPYSR